MKKETQDYTKVFTEVDEIFNHFPEDLLKKIPVRLKKEIKENKNTEYKFKYNEKKQLMDQNIYTQTKDFISLIYIIYACNKEEKQRLLDICRDNEKQIEEQKKKDYKDNLFKEESNESNKKQKNEAKKKEDKKTALATKEEKWYTKIINKIKNFFKKV